MKSLISQLRWPMHGLAAVTLALVFAFASTISAFAFALVQLSSDPFTNATSQHATEVEPDTLSSGATIVSAFQVGRFFDGGATDIGVARSTDGGATWATPHFLPGLTATSGQPDAHGRSHERVSD